MHSLSRCFIPLALISAASAVPEGFTIHEFAGPPQVDYPTSISAAPNGDLYVSSDQDGSLGRAPHMGRIIRCRDTDGDGKADEFVHFVPDVGSPRGSHFVGDTLYLIHPPFLSAYRDTNGDGVADEEKILVTGLGGGIENPRGADHTTNGVRMGIDGWLYISVGDFGAHPAKGTDGSTYVLHGGGVLRVRPDGSQIEPYALMTRNICDTAISPELDLFSRDNTNDGKGWNTRFHHYTELANMGYPRLYKNFGDEAIIPLADYGGGSGTGALWLDEPGFPPAFRNMLFSCDWTTGNIYYHPLERSGATFKIDQKVFQELPRAIDIDVDGNSKLYLADWRGATFNFEGPGKPVGMIHQVLYPGETPAKYTDVHTVKDRELVGLLASASAVQRLEAQREILKRAPKPDFAHDVLVLAQDTKRDIAVRTAAIFTLKQLLGASSTKYLSGMLRDGAVREQVLRAMADRSGELDGVPVAAYENALTDPNPRVALQGLIGLQKLNATNSAARIIAASKTWKEPEGSPRLPHTAMQVLVSLRNIPPCLEAVADPATRTLALRSLERLHRPDVVDGLIDQLNKTQDPALAFDLLSALARLHYDEKPWDLKSWWETRPDDRGPYYAPVEWAQTARIREAIEKKFSLVAKDRQNDLLDVLGKNRLPISDLKLEGVDPVMTALSSKQLNPSQLKLLAEAAKDAKRPFSRRAECYRAIVSAGEDESLPYRLSVLATWTKDKEAEPEAAQFLNDFVNSPARGGQIDELRELGSAEGNAGSQIAWEALLTVSHSPLSKPEAKKEVQNLTDRSPKEVGFFAAIAALKMPGFDKQIEDGIHWDNTEVIEAATAAKAAIATTASSGKHVAELPVEEVSKAALTGHGDVATGQRLFTSLGCISCHATDLKAEQKGPYLGAAGAKFPREYLIESILDPNKVVAQGFQTALFKMKDGSSKLGFVTAEADGVVELRDIQGAVSRFKRDDAAEEQRLPNSMMPPGLASGLTIEDFTSLVEYLASLKATGG
ncbi:MAG: putative heme-binding protein [Akkermansiaceae bacterium]|nr:putative heme-binding protein [Akkermansiaceae bacterium]